MSYRSGPFSQGSNEPITYLRGVAVDATSILVALHVLAMLAIAILQAANPQLLGHIAPSIIFTPNAWTNGHPWTALTYPFWHLISSAHIFFAVEMIWFYMFGREVERYIGRREYLAFYGLLILVPTVLFTLLTPWLGKAPFQGSSILHMGVFLGFVALYPHVQFFPGLAARWVAWILIGIYSLFYLSTHRWLDLAYLWTTAATAYAYMHYTGATGQIGLRQWVDSWRQHQAEKRFVRRREAYQKKVEKQEQSVDTILEKISREGMDALSRQERSTLEKASRKLAKDSKFSG